MLYNFADQLISINPQPRPPHPAPGCGSGETVEWQCDGLKRRTSASTTAGTGWGRGFSDDGLGNVVNMLEISAMSTIASFTAHRLTRG